MRRAAWIGAATLALALSPAHPWLEASMPRLVLLAMPAWFALGLIAAGLSGRSWTRGNPLGLTGLGGAIGALGFWMIPRSVDAVRSSAPADLLLHVSLLAAGAALAASWRALPFVVRGALGIYGAAMTIALGFIYSSYSALLCGTFDLAQQRRTGWWLLRASPAFVLLVVAAGALSLRSAARRWAQHRAGSPPSPAGATRAARADRSEIRTAAARG